MKALQSSPQQPTPRRDATTNTYGGSIRRNNPLIDTKLIERHQNHFARHSLDMVFGPCTDGLLPALPCLIVYFM